MTHLRTINRCGTLALAGCLALASAACGDDAPAPGRDQAEATGDGRTGSSGDIDAACDAYFAADRAFLEEAEDVFASPNPEPAKAFLTERIVPEADILRARAPAEISGQATILADGVHDAAASGDFSSFESEEFAAADDAVQDYLFANCPGDQLDITAVDYAFDGADDMVPATDRALIRLSNESETELHEVIILKRNEGTHEPLDEVLALPEEQTFAKVTFVGGAFGVEPGDDIVTSAELTPGRYALVCFVPRGATAEDLESGAPPQGTPHSQLGMTHEFTVR